MCLLDQALWHKDIWGSYCIAPPFLTSSLVGFEWSASCPRRIIPRGKNYLYPLDRRPQNQFLALCTVEWNWVDRSDFDRLLHIQRNVSQINRCTAHKSYRMYRSDGRFWPVVLCCAVVICKLASLRLVSMRSDTIFPQ
jgi:hypothetical protein